MGIDEPGIVGELHTVRDWVRWCVSVFARAELHFGHGTDNPLDEASQLLCWHLHLPWERLESFADTRLTTQEKQQLLEYVRLRVQHRMPLPYITGVAHFSGYEFHVTPDVLIPRSPMAELIHDGFQPWLDHEPAAILDLCAGSGCIGIACAQAFPHAEVHLADISPEALGIAQINIDWHQLGDRVFAVESDLFAALEGEYDLIVCNPPYVDQQDMDALPPEFLHEPRLALASGADGLDFTRRLLSEAARYLTDQGRMFVEVGNSWNTLEAAFPRVPFEWLEFAHGGIGVFTINRKTLQSHRADFN